MEKDKRISEETRIAAENFIRKIKTGEIKREVEPGSSNGVSFDDKKDFENFVKFSETDFYRELLEQ